MSRYHVSGPLNAGDVGRCFWVTTRQAFWDTDPPPGLPGPFQTVLCSSADTARLIVRLLNDLAGYPNDE